MDVRMRMRYKSALLFVFLLIVGCVILRVSYAFYIEVTDEAVVIVDGDITINYLNGNIFNYKEDSTIKFSVTNNGSESVSYYISMYDVVSNGATYKLSNKDDLNIEDNLATSTISSFISIAAHETQNYELTITNDSKEEYSGRLVVGLEAHTTETFAETIMKNNEIKETPTTSFKENAVTNEGLIKTQDNHGEAYYFRGKIDNNYVSFADFTWRIVGINGDGSVKLVLNTLTDTLSTYYNENPEFLSSDVYTSLTSWYELNLKDYADIISNHKFCNDVNVEGADEIYAAYNRISKNFIPNSICLGTKTLTKIGLLSADEVAMAGGTATANQEYYLYNEAIETNYFTMTSAKDANKEYYPYIVTTDGALNTESSGRLNRGVRPVINIIKNISVSGSGTYEDPYILVME